MIRRDYILRMIEEFIRALAGIRSSKKGARWQEAEGAIEEQLRRLLNASPKEILEWSETELLARLIHDEPTQAVRDKVLLVVTLLSETGEVAAAQGREEEGRLFHSKALHLLLDVLARSEAFEFPDFVPKVDALMAALRNAPLDMRTRAALMQHFERVGEFGKAEDQLFAMIESEPDNVELLRFGSAFYDRLLRQSDEALAAGNLSRAEGETGRKEIEARLKMRDGS